MKRIVICGDGTWNERDRLDKNTGTRRPTNVTKTARAVLPRDANGISQIVYYHAGVGTGGPLDSLTGGAFGEGMEHNIREMYRFIVYNHEPGDELYLFGFSRGAYTVRSLAGFLDFAGLVSKSEDYYVPDLYDCYMSAMGRAMGPDVPGWNRLFVEPRRKGPGTRMQDRRATSPKVRFLGVWDTVGSLGPPGLLGQIARRMQPCRHGYHRVALTPTVQTAAHALAIDEHREPFLPTMFSATGWSGTLHQCWFAGVHTDIGGGYDYDDHANHALHWMLDLAGAEGLALDHDYLMPFGSRPAEPLHDSMSALYRVLGPRQRTIGETPDGRETVHPSVHARMQAVPDYRPPNLVRWLERQLPR